MQLLDLSTGGAIVFALVLLLASFIRGYSGFGFSAVLMAGLGLVLPRAEIVPLAVALEVLASVGQARTIWNDIHWRHLWVILGTGIVGNPVGVWLSWRFRANCCLLSFISSLRWRARFCSFRLD